MVIAPMYLTEIAPVKYRGIFGTLGQLGVVSTILISQVCWKASKLNETNKLQNAYLTQILAFFL